MFYKIVEKQLVNIPTVAANKSEEQLLGWVRGPCGLRHLAAKYLICGGGSTNSTNLYVTTAAGLPYKQLKAPTRSYILCLRYYNILLYMCMYYMYSFCFFFNLRLLYIILVYKRCII